MTTEWALVGGEGFVLHKLTVDFVKAVPDVMALILAAGLSVDTNNRS